jgi:hypothetical protein
MVSGEFRAADSQDGGFKSDRLLTLDDKSGLSPSLPSKIIDVRHTQWELKERDLSLWLPLRHPLRLPNGKSSTSYTKDGRKTELLAELRKSWGPVGTMGELPIHFEETFSLDPVTDRRSICARLSHFVDKVRY